MPLVQWRLEPQSEGISAFVFALISVSLHDRWVDGLSKGDGL